MPSKTIAHTDGSSIPNSAYIKWYANDKSLRYFSYPLSARRLSLLSLAAHHLVMCGIHLPLRSTVIPSRESSRSKMNFNLWPKVPSPSLSLVRNSKTYVINWQPWDIRLMTQIKSRWFLHGLGSNFVGFSLILKLTRIRCPLFLLFFRWQNPMIFFTKAMNFGSSSSGSAAFATQHGRSGPGHGGRQTHHSSSGRGGGRSSSFFNPG